MNELARLAEVKKMILYLYKSTIVGSPKLDWEVANTPNRFILKFDNEIWVSVSEIDDMEGDPNDNDYVISVYSGRQELFQLHRNLFDFESFKKEYGELPHIVFKEIYVSAKYKALNITGILGRINDSLESVIKIS